MMGAEGEKQDQGDRNADEPQQHGTHWTCPFVFRLAGERVRGRNSSLPRGKLSLSANRRKLHLAFTPGWQSPAIEREEAPGIIVTSGYQDDPVQVYTKGNAAALPVMYTPDIHIAAKVF